MKTTPLLPLESPGKPRRVVLIVQHLVRGEIEFQVLEQLKQANANERIFIISLEGNIEQAIKLWPELETYRQQLFFLRKEPGVHPSLFVALYRLLKVLKPQVVHTHHIGPLLYGGIAARFSGVRNRTHTEHCTKHLEYTRLARIEDAAIKVAKPAIIAATPTVKRTLASLFPKVSAKVIRPGIDCDSFSKGDQLVARERLNLPNEAVLLGADCHAGDSPGLLSLMRALYYLPENVHLVLNNSAELSSSITVLSEKLGVGSRVHQIQHMIDEPYFYQALNLYFQLGSGGIHALSALRAQACGVRVIATDRCSNREMLCPSSSIMTSGHLFALLKQIEIALNTPFSPSPRTYTIEKFDIQRACEEYRSLVTRLTI